MQLPMSPCQSSPLVGSCISQDNCTRLSSNLKQFFYQLNIQDEIKITCGKFNHEAVCETHLVIIIKRKDLCDCVIQTIEIQLIESHSNSSSNDNFIIYHTFNFVTEWLYNKLTMPYYREKEHILQLPSQASLPTINVVQSNTSNIFTKKKVPTISIHQLDSLVNKLKHKDIYLSHSDKHGEDSMLFNCSLEQNMDDNNTILDINSRLDDDTDSSMMLTLISCTNALVAHIFLIVLNMRNCEGSCHFMWQA